MPEFSVTLVSDGYFIWVYLKIDMFKKILSRLMGLAKPI